MKKSKLMTLPAFLILASTAIATAGPKVDIDNMEQMVRQGYEVVISLGEAAYPSINDPEGEFVWKNEDGSKGNVGVIDCESGIIVADYEVPGLSIMEVKDAKTGDAVLKNICQTKAAQGAWIEFAWNDAARDNQPHRSVLYYITTPGDALVIYSFGWDDITSLEVLNKK